MSNQSAFNKYNIAESYISGSQYLFKACCGRQPGTPEEMTLTVGQLNHYLDQLAGDGVNEGKVKTLTQLLQVTTPNQMKWIIQILLRDLKASHQLTRCAPHPCSSSRQVI